MQRLSNSNTEQKPNADNNHVTGELSSGEVKNYQILTLLVVRGALGW